MREITRLLKEGLIVEVREDDGYLCDDGRFIKRYSKDGGRTDGWIIDGGCLVYRSFFEAYEECDRFAKRISK